MSDKKQQGLEVFNLDSPILVKDTISKIKNTILSGTIDEAKAGIILKRMEKISKEVLADKEVKDVIREESVKHLPNGKPGEFFGAKISESAVHTFYLFGGCGDPLWDALNDIEKTIKVHKKERETYLKTLIPTTSNLQQTEMGFGIKKTSKTEVIENVPKLIWSASGEIVEIEPPIKGQKMGIKYLKL